MDQRDNHELLRAWHAGDNEALALIIARTAGIVRAACQRQAPSQEIDDCIQAVYLVLSRRPAAALRAPLLEAWLLRVAGFVCARARRGAARRHRTEAQSQPIREATEDGTSEILSHLDDCLARLPERQRAAVTLRFLMGQPFDVVASRLGITEANAYQLVCRGIAGLRHLLRQRGFALDAAALTALLSIQCKVAASSAETAVVTGLLANPHSATASTLATGVCTTMTLLRLSYVTGFVLLGCLSAGLYVTGAETSEPKTVPMAEPTAVSTNISEPALAQFLNQEVSLDYKETPLAEVLDFLQRLTGVPMRVDPTVDLAGKPSITIRVTHMEMRYFLDHIERISGLSHRIEDGVYVIEDGQEHPVYPEPRSDDEEPWRAALRARLDATVTCDFKETPLQEVIAFFQMISGCDIIMSPDILDRQQYPTTLSLQNMSLRQALALVERSHGLSHAVHGQAYVIFREPPAAAISSSTSTDEK